MVRSFSLRKRAALLWCCTCRQKMAITHQSCFMTVASCWRLQAPGWPCHMGAVTADMAPAPLPSPPQRPSEEGSLATRGSVAARVESGTTKGDGELLRRCISAAAQAVAAAVGQLDEMDSRVGDGDCGATLALAASAILEVQLPLSTFHCFCFLLCLIAPDVRPCMLQNML